MNVKNQTEFCIHTLNQEKLLNELSKTFTLFEINRLSKNETTFKCSYFEYKNIEKVLKTKEIEIKYIKHQGMASKISKIATSLGLIGAIVVFSIFYFIQSQFVWQYDVQGVDKLPAVEVVSFLKENFSNRKSEINTKNVEVALVDNFEEISFVSCMLKGQTLVVNIKEKLLPDEIYGDFKPIKSHKSGKITKIELISGTVKVKVGDIVRAGDILVEPYTIDTSGVIKKVEAKAKIWADVYNEGSVDHYENFIEINRT